MLGTATNLYEDMAQRTGGDVYIGVVGPVRTGKSTFVKRVMETLSFPTSKTSISGSVPATSCPRAPLGEPS